MSVAIFYLFATFLIFSGLMVVLSRNPVHSVLFLILAFFNAAALFLFLQAEFLAMMLIIVYVGAVAVLFLFVVMMLDVRAQNIKNIFSVAQLKSWGKSIVGFSSYGILFFVSTIILWYLSSVVLSYVLTTLSHFVSSNGYASSSFDHFVDRLQDLEGFEFIYVLITSEGFPLPRGVHFLSANFGYESVLSFLLMLVSIIQSNIFARRVMNRLIEKRFDGIVFSSPMVVLVSLGLLTLLLYVAKKWTVSPLLHSLSLEPMAHKLGLTNTQALGMIVYTHYALVFQMAGVLLLIAMIGAIVLTLRKREGVKKQSVRHQISRTKDNSLEVKKVPLREGVSI